ncbi:protein kinase [Aeromicrobium sp. S22]|uniref:serine/threonine-protein kinase n=1 Tax=Aeromicrobium sp. S22 TaxID=2662029 RepID=UPI00129DD2A0|nr:serine/threonine-protein kinase [Aeromicrobium sp. S22]MRK02936.1 protein kinase [Aeromicrobium sp. S22]
MGEVFAGRYELVDVLDSGGMGVVWRVWDLRDRTYRAGKMLRQSDGASLLRFVREIGTRVDHPHVVAPTGWSAEDDRVLFAMPLVDGGSVATLIADYGPLPPSFVREVGLQLLDALDAVHRADIVHRDVKPANILLEATGTGTPHVRLSDFGIATTRDEPRLTRASEMVHTPGYAAPEVQERADPSPLQDLYSVGTVLAEMLTGSRPTHAGPPVPADGPFATWCGRLCATRPDERYASAAEARAALLSIDPLDEPGDPIEVFRQLPELPPGWGPDGPSSRRHRIDARTRLRLLAGGLAVAGLGLVAASARLLLG